MYKTEIEYDKPVYAGTSILDLSKLCMMDFHYNTIQKHVPGHYNLVYSDTDSMVYYIQHEDIYDWIKQNKQRFDLSDSARPHMKDNTNKKVWGKFSNVSLGFWIESQPWSDNVLRFVFRDANTLAHDTVQIREVLIRIFVVTELTSLGVEGHFFA